jgi:hypothetical protein
MRIRATCNACGRDFLFFELYNADAWHDDRCPHCNRHLGMTGARHLALAADRAAARLVQALREIADRTPGFAVKPDSVLGRIEEVIAELAPQPADPDEDVDAEPTTRRRWLRRAA